MKTVTGSALKVLFQKRVKSTKQVFRTGCAKRKLKSFDSFSRGGKQDLFESLINMSSPRNMVPLRIPIPVKFSCHSCDSQLCLNQSDS